MSDATASLVLPFIMPAQAQKHVTHNEALLALDAVVQLVLTAEATIPPALPAEGACFWIAAGATDGWAGHSGKIGVWQDGAWSFVTPRPGWHAFDLASQRLKIFDGAAWIEPALPAAAAFSSVGIAAMADEVNRLVVSAPATLFNHSGAGHQLKINKAGAADTASLLFQTAWQGRAELGLNGSDQFTIKVSGDGSDWKTALAVGPDGIARTDTRPAARAARTAMDHTPVSGSLSGFDDLQPARGGFALGAALPSGFGNRLLVPADGLYLVGLGLYVISSSGHAARVMRNGIDQIVSVEGAASIAPLTQLAIGLAPLSAGDWLSIKHEGNASIGFGPTRTDIIAVLL